VIEELSSDHIHDIIFVLPGIFPIGLQIQRFSTMMNEGYRACSGCGREVMVSSRGLFLPHKDKKTKAPCPMSGKPPNYDICDFCGKKIANPDNETRYCSEECERRDSRRRLKPVNQELSRRKSKALKFSNPLYFN
jgi:predicted nucleic acid-binding Zn ribbon protein